VFWNDLARVVTTVWNSKGKLPHIGLSPLITYNRVQASFKWTPDHSSVFTGFMYTNSWTDTENVEENYAYFFGPCIDMKEAIPDVWDFLADEVRVNIMAHILGAK
jgi:hypothetical protein